MKAGERAAAVEIVFLDVDGTLTDGRLYMQADGVIMRAYHALDGYGIKRFIRHGGTIAVVTAGDGCGVEARMRQLGVAHVYVQAEDKLTMVRQVLAAESLSPQQAAFVGDDLPDLPAMQHVGFAAAPPTAAAEVLASAHYVAERPPGFGAVREVCDFILRHKCSNRPI